MAAIQRNLYVTVGLRLAIFFLATLFLIAPIAPAAAHGGGLDSDGGHNCNVGSCAGTYHCHQARGPRCGGVQYQAPSIPTSLASCVRLFGTQMTRGEVKLMQIALLADGFNPGPIDGYFGRRTSIAVNAYELYYGIDVSPNRKVYFQTLEHMGIDC